MYIVRCYSNVRFKSIVLLLLITICQKEMKKSEQMLYNLNEKEWEK